MTIPISGRKQMFKNFYFTKLHIMHIFGWLILKINILIPTLFGKSKKLTIKNTIRRFRRKLSTKVNFKKPKSFFCKYRGDYGNIIYKKQYNIIKNFFFFNHYLNKNNNLLETYSWF